MPFYRNILKQSLSLTWRNKYLWWFGIFAALLGNGGEFEILFNNPGANPGQTLFPLWNRIAATGVFSRQTLSNIGGLFKNDTLNMVFVSAVFLIALAVFLFLIWAIIVSQAAIVNNSASVIRNKKHSFRDGVNFGILNFWPVFSLNIIIKAIIFALLFAVSIPVIFFKADFNFNLSHIAFLAVAAVAAMILSFIMKYAIACVVVNKSKIFPAIRRSWTLFRKNWLISFEMAVVLFFINLSVGFAVILCILLLAVPFLFLAMVFYSFSVLCSWLIVISAFTVFLFIIIFIGASLSIFQISSWTGLFLELDKNSCESKLVRIANNIIAR